MNTMWLILPNCCRQSGVVVGRCSFLYSCTAEYVEGEGLGASSCGHGRSSKIKNKQCFRSNRGASNTYASTNASDGTANDLHYLNNNKGKTIVLDIVSPTDEVVGHFQGNFVFTCTLSRHNPQVNYSNQDESNKFMYTQQQQHHASESFSPTIGRSSVNANGGDSAPIVHMSIPLVHTVPKDVDLNILEQTRVAERVILEDQERQKQAAREAAKVRSPHVSSAYANEPAAPVAGSGEEDVEDNGFGGSNSGFGSRGGASADAQESSSMLRDGQHCEHQKIYLEVDSTQIAPELLELHPNESIDVTVHYHTSATPRVVEKEVVPPPVSTLRMPRAGGDGTGLLGTSIGLGSPVATPGRKKTSSHFGHNGPSGGEPFSTSSCYLGGILRSRGRWGNTCELCLHDINKAPSYLANNSTSTRADMQRSIENFPTELDIELSVTKLIQKQKFSLASSLTNQNMTKLSAQTPRGFQSPGGSASFMSPGKSPFKALSAMKTKASSNFAQTSTARTITVKQQLLCTGKITLANLVNEERPSISTTADDSDSVGRPQGHVAGGKLHGFKRPENCLRTGIYEVLLESTPNPHRNTAELSNSALAAAAADCMKPVSSTLVPPIIVGKVRIRLFIPDDEDDLIYSLVMWSNFRNLQFISDSHHLMAASGSLHTTNSITALRLNYDRNYLITTLKIDDNTVPLPNWLLLSDNIAACGGDSGPEPVSGSGSVPAATIRDMYGGELDLDSDEEEAHYHSTMAKDTQLVQNLYDAMAIKDLIQILSYCGGRVLKWGSTMIRDYVAGKLSFQLQTEKDWCNIRVLDVQYNQEENYTAEDHVSNSDGILAAVIRRCIVTLSADQLCNFDMYCYVLSLMHCQYAALVSLWSFFQVWLQSEFSSKLVECASSPLANLDPNLPAHASVEYVEYLLQPEQRQAWTDCFLCCWALRLIVLHEDIYMSDYIYNGEPDASPGSKRTNTHLECTEFCGSCTELAVELTQTLLLTGIQIFHSLESVVRKVKEAQVFDELEGIEQALHDDDEDESAFNIRKHLDTNSGIISTIIRSVSVLAEVAFDSTKQKDTTLPLTLQLLATFSERMINCVDYLAPLCWQHFVAFLSMILRIQLLQSAAEAEEYENCNYSLEVKKMHFEPIELSQSIVTNKMNKSGIVDPILLSCIAAVGECLQQHLLLINNGNKHIWGISRLWPKHAGEDIVQRAEGEMKHNESIALELVTIAELLSEAIVSQVQGARYKALINAIQMPLPPPIQNRRARATVTADMQMPTDLSQSTHLTTMPAFISADEEAAVRAQQRQRLLHEQSFLANDTDYYEADDASIDSSFQLHKGRGGQPGPGPPSGRPRKAGHGSNMVQVHGQGHGYGPSQSLNTDFAYANASMVVSVVPSNSNIYRSKKAAPLRNTTPPLIDSFNASATSGRNGVFPLPDGRTTLAPPRSRSQFRSPAAIVDPPSLAYTLQPLKGATVVVFMKHIEEYLGAFMDVMDASMYIAGHITDNTILLQKSYATASIGSLAGIASGTELVVNNTPSSSILTKLVHINSHLLAQLAFGVNAVVDREATLLEKSQDVPEVDRVIQFNMLHELLSNAIVNSSDIDGACLMPALLVLIESLRRVVSVKSSSCCAGGGSGGVPGDAAAAAAGTTTARPVIASPATVVENMLLNSQYMALLDTYSVTFYKRLDRYIFGPVSTGPIRVKDFSDSVVPSLSQDNINIVRNIWRGLVGVSVEMLTCYCSSIILQLENHVLMAQAQKVKASAAVVTTVASTLSPIELLMKELLTAFEAPVSYLNELLLKLLNPTTLPFSAPSRGSSTNKTGRYSANRHSSRTYVPSPPSPPPPVREPPTPPGSDAVKRSIQRALYLEFLNLAPKLIESLVVLAYSLPILESSRKDSSIAIQDNNDKNVVITSIQVMRSALLSSSILVMHLIMMFSTHSHHAHHHGFHHQHLQWSNNNNNNTTMTGTDATAGASVVGVSEYGSHSNHNTTNSSSAHGHREKDEPGDKLIKDDILLMKHVNHLIVHSITRLVKGKLGTKATRASGRYAVDGNDEEGDELWTCLAEMCPSLKPLLLMGGVGGGHTTEDGCTKSIEYMGQYISMESAAKMKFSRERAVSTLSVFVSAANKLIRNMHSNHINTDYIVGLKERIRRNMGIIRLYVSAISKRDPKGRLNPTPNDRFNNLSIIASLQGTITKLWWQLPNEERENRYRNNYGYLFDGNPVKFVQSVAERRFMDEDEENQNDANSHTELKASVIASLNELLALSSNSRALSRNVGSSSTAAAAADMTFAGAGSNSRDTMIVPNCTLLDSMGGVWLGTQSAASLILQKEFITDRFYLVLMQKIIADASGSNVSNVEALIVMLRQFTKDNSALEDSTKPVVSLSFDSSSLFSSSGVDGAGGLQTPFSPVRSPIISSSNKLPAVNAPAAMMSSPFLKMQDEFLQFPDGLPGAGSTQQSLQSAANLMTNMMSASKESKIMQYQRILQHYAVTLITELEKIHQLLRDSISYLYQSGEWELSYGVLNELRIHYKNIVLPTFHSTSSGTSGGASSALFATAAMKHIKSAWNVRRDSMLAEIDRTLDKIQERLRHDEYHRPLPLVYAVRFLSSPWEDEEEVEVVHVPGSPNPAGNKAKPKPGTAKRRNSILNTKSSKELSLADFYEATNFEVIVIDSEGHYIYTGDSKSKSDDPLAHFAKDGGGIGIGMSGAAADGLDTPEDNLQQQVHQLQNNQQRRRSREIWLLMKYDVLSHVHTSRVYEAIIKLQEKTNKALHEQMKQAMSDIFNPNAAKKNFLDVEDDRAAFSLPENTYFHLVEELRKAFPAFRIHSPGSLVEDMYAVPCKVMQIFPAYPVITNVNGLESYSEVIDDCIVRLGCEVPVSSVTHSALDEANISATGGNRSSQVQGRPGFRNSISNNNNNGPSGGFGMAPPPPPPPRGHATKIKSDFPEKDVSAWEMLAHCTDFYVYTYADPNTAAPSSANSQQNPSAVNENGDRKYTFTTEDDAVTGAVLRIKLSTKCIKYAEAFEQQHPSNNNSIGTESHAADSHNRTLSRLNYWLSPSSTAFIEETVRISTATAYVEVLSYTKLVVAHIDNFLTHVKALEPQAVVQEPMYDITSSRSLISAAVSHLSNMIGTPAPCVIGLHNASTIVSTLTVTNASPFTASILYMFLFYTCVLMFSPYHLILSYVL